MIENLLAAGAATSSWFSFSRTLTILSYLSYITLLLALISIPSVLVKRRGRPQAALSWVLIMVALPVLGLFFWWAIGRTHLARKKRKRRRALQKVSQRISQLQDEVSAVPEVSWDLMPIDRLPPDDAEWAFSPTRGNRTELLVDAAETYAELERMIAGAQEFIHIIFYIWRSDEIGAKFRDLLVEKTRSGVQVRLILDAFGASPALGRFMQALRDAGGEITAFGPPILRRWHLELNFRNHRKLVLVDGRLAVVGGLNIGREYTDHWHDVALRLQGPVLDQLQEVFVEDWAFAKGKDFVDSSCFGRWRADEAELAAGDTALCAVVASGPHSDLNLTHEAFLLAITGATKRIWLTTPYFVPDPTILASLRTAVLRGIDVRILVPEEPDAWIVGLASRSYYPFLLRSRVRIFEYCDGTLHAKAAVFDDDLAFVGSANMDVRSFRLNFELSCFVQNKTLCEQMATLFEKNQDAAREVLPADIENRSYLAQLSESAANLMSPLL